MGGVEWFVRPQPIFLWCQTNTRTFCFCWTLLLFLPPDITYLRVILALALIGIFQRIALQPSPDDLSSSL